MTKKLIENQVIAFLGNDDSPDISNPIHSTEVAQAYGFAGASGFPRNSSRTPLNLDADQKSQQHRFVSVL